MKFKLITSGTLAALLTVSCAKTADEPVTYLTFYSGTPPSTKIANPPSDQTQLEKGQRVGLYIFPKTSSPIATINQELIVSDNNMLNPVIPIVRPEGPLEIFAYNPYFEEITDVSTTKTFFINTAQDTQYGFRENDVMFGEPVVNPIGANEMKVVIRFIHKLSKIDVKLTTNGSVTSLQSAKIRILNTYRKAIIDPRHKTISPAGEPKDPILIAAFSHTETSFRASGIILPQTINRGTDLIEVELASGKKLFHTLSSNGTFEPGKLYTYNITVNAENLTVNSSIKAWASPDVIDGDVF